MLDLKLMDYAAGLKVQARDGKKKVWDPVRKQWVALLPEEFVRQLTLAYLIQERGYPASALAVEKTLRGHHLKKRCDIVAFSIRSNPFLLIECKAPDITLGTEVFLQAANYNLALQVPFLMMTNGQQSYCCHLDYQGRQINDLPEVPGYPAAPRI
ncbi:MAG: type I restriction enzyme HsdR N-terminal domain-containing protein [Saprospiraceae bacterium]|jgi:hypothetical protein